MRNTALGSRRTAALSVVVGLSLAVAARAEPPGKAACRERLTDLQKLLTAARGALRGPVMYANPPPGFELPVVRSSRPLEIKAQVVQIGRDGVWLNGKAMSGASQPVRLAAATAEIEKAWANYFVIYPDGHPDRRIYALLDERLTVAEVARAVADLGGKDRLIPLVLSGSWTGPISSAQAQERMGSLRAQVDAVSGATPATMLARAMGPCALPRKLPNPENPKSDDQFREEQHEEVLRGLRSCGCAGADIGVVENLLLHEAGALSPTLRRLPIELTPSGGKVVVGATDAPFFDVVAAMALAAGDKATIVTVGAKAGAKLPPRGASRR